MKESKYLKLYNQWIKTNPVCACGCGRSLSEVVTFEKFRMSMSKQKRPMIYYSFKCSGNKNKRKYLKEYEEWLNSKPLCKCGCGKPLQSNYRVFINSLNKRKSPPQYLKNHCHVKKGFKGGNNSKQVNFRGCNILISKNDERCKDFQNCKEYLDCLDFVVVSHKARGWRKINERLQVA